MASLLGIDIGSSAVKAGLYDVAGRELRVARIEHRSVGEVDPRSWWEAARAAVAALHASGVVAIGVCGRGGTNVLLGRDGEPVAPSWDDDRAREVRRELAGEHGDGLSPQSLWLFAKAELARRQGIDVRAALSAKDYVVYRLTGRLVSDAASGGAPDARHLPLVAARPPWKCAGTTRSPLAGAPAGTPVAVGWHDGACATFGAGASVERAAPVTLGTNAVYRVVTRELPPGLLKYWDLTPGLTVTGGDIVGAGTAYAWARSLLPNADPAHSPPGAGGAAFLPQMAGRIAPTRNAGARGSWHGLSSTTTEHDLLRAVIEGTAFSLRQLRDWLAEHGLRAQGATVATGGGSRNPVQIQALADTLSEPVEVAGLEEGCRGAALLGAVAARIMTLEEARLLTPTRLAVAPDPARYDAIERAYRRFVALQRASDEVQCD